MDAYEAWQFIENHPKINRKLIQKHVTKKEVPDLIDGRVPVFEFNLGDDEIAYYRMYSHDAETAISKLYIAYVKVDKNGKINKDKNKNKFTEVWLEMGQLDYTKSITENKLWGFYDSYEPKKLDYHEPDLDCGAPTFDEAIVKLANLVARKYGKYKKEKDICNENDLCLNCKEARKAFDNILKANHKDTKSYT